MKIISIVIAVLCSLLVPVTGFMALFAGMAMDAPGNKTQWFTVILIKKPVT